MYARIQKYLLPAIIAGTVLGALMGIFAPAASQYVKVVGDLFMNALKMLVIPLIVASIITGITALGDVRKIGGLGGRTLVYYAATTALSVLTGIIIVNIVQPGRNVKRLEDVFPNARYSISSRPLSGGSVLKMTDGTTFHNRSYGKGFAVRLVDQGLEGSIDTESRMTADSVTVTRWKDAGGKVAEPKPEGAGVKIVRRTAPYSIKDLVLGLVPENIFSAMAEMDVLPLILFSIFFGAVITTLGEKGRRLIELFDSLNDAVMAMVRLVMLTSPLGIFALVAARLGEAQLTIEGGFITELSRLGLYAASVIIALLIHAFITLPLILRLVGRRDVLPYARNLMPVFFTAFGTASSAATLPLTMETLIDKNEVSEGSVSFVCPLGATVNMDGTALYEAVAALFIAQVYGIHLNMYQQFIVFLTAILAGTGAAAIPEAGLVTMVMVLSAAGLPIEGMAIILTIDWFLDRCRTTVNVWGDCVGARVIDRLEHKK